METPLDVVLYKISISLLTLCVSTEKFLGSKWTFLIKIWIESERRLKKDQSKEAEAEIQELLYNASKVNLENNWNFLCP